MKSQKGKELITAKEDYCPAHVRLARRNAATGTPAATAGNSFTYENEGFQENSPKGKKVCDIFNTLILKKSN